MCAWLGLRRNTLLSSGMGIAGERSERLLKLCLALGATHYLSGSAARGYLDVELFERAGIGVEWQDYQHPNYPQLYGAFMPYLSALDLILNCGDGSAAVLGISCEGETA
ncbi:MAG: WbqC family protein [Chloroflexi bacterium]|nr:WbqC family protein [Chloroflexota bacterium]